MAIRAFRTRLGRVAAALLFGIGVQYHAMTLFDLSPHLLSFRFAPVTTTLTIAVLTFCVIALLLPLQRHAKRFRGWRRASLLLFLAAAVIVLPSTFLLRNFGLDDFDTVITSLFSNDSADLISVGVQDFGRSLAEMTLLTLVVVIAAIHLLRTLPGFAALLVPLSLVAILISSPVRHLRAMAWPDPARDLVTLADFRPPVILSRPEAAPNLVLIYLESLERTYRAIPATADAFAALAEAEDQGFSARNIGQIHNTHFTAAGLTATNCGIPLFSRGLVSSQLEDNAEINKRLGVERFFPNVTCLSDLLRQQGHTGVYINNAKGSEFTIGDILLSHGYERIRGLAGEPEYADLPGSNSWGTSDDVVFTEAKKELGQLAGRGDPFFLSVLTSATHGPDGFPDPGCAYAPPIPADDPDSAMPRAIRCTADHVGDLLAEINRLGLGDRTIVAIMSDHLAMKNTLWTELMEVEPERRNLFIILNGPERLMSRVNLREATMMDIYPTLLEVMGFELQDGAANLGRSLLGDRPTLAETHGIELLDRALSANRDIRDHVWATD